MEDDGSNLLFQLLPYIDDRYYIPVILCSKTRCMYVEYKVEEGGFSTQHVPTAVHRVLSNRACYGAIYDEAFSEIDIF